MSYNSKYTGEQVDALLDIVSQGGGGGGEGGGTITEAEIAAMGFTKNAGTVTGIKMNGATKGTSGVVDLGTVITSHQDISGKQDKITDLDTIRSGAAAGATALQSVPAEYITETELSNKGYATTSQLANKQDKITDLDAIRSGAAAGATALQSYTEKYTGTITGIKMNGATKGTSGVVDLGTVITSHQDISGKQDKLVSGTNIKTINGTSILGSGNIVINSGSGGGSSSGSSNYPVVDATTVLQGNTLTMEQDTYYYFDARNSSGNIDLVLNTTDNSALHEFIIEIKTSSLGGLSISLPDDVVWQNDDYPEIGDGWVFVISIVRNRAMYAKFAA